MPISPYWVYYRIDKGGMGVVKDVNTGLYLFPDEPETLEKFKDFKAGKLHNLRFS